MCRISGIVHRSSTPAIDQITSMRDSMLHGGPDDAGVYIDEELHLALGHRRLSLIDLSAAGHQPMFSKDKNLVIVFNGEIYNYKEIQQELQSLGHNFISHSDTEVIIAAYAQWGKDCFSRFNGMFALAILDKLNGKLILARDHAGIKPLYYSFENGSLYFASEIRAFKTIYSNWKTNPDWRTYFLVFGYIPEPYTTLENVYTLSKGNWMEISLNTFNQQQGQFAQPNYQYTIHSEQEAVTKVKDALDAAVKRHLISDAPIGLFLSGGIDSSILTLLAKKYCGDQLQTLSIDFEESSFSEKKYQQIIIDATNAKHQSFIVSKQDFIDAIPDILEAIDQPSNDGINSYFITRYAKEAGLKAVLSGIGADELFGGYPSFKRTGLLGYTQLIPPFLLKAAVLFPDDKKKKIQFLVDTRFPGHYLFNRGFFTPDRVAAYLDIPISKVNRVIESVALPAANKAMHPLEQVAFEETNLYMQNQLLKDTDYMSMWHSVEVRVPFLDKDLMNLVYSIHPDIRYNSKQTKHLLIKAFADILPEAIWNRPKQGFTFPFQQWFNQVNIPTTNNPILQQMQAGLVNGKTHWSRYWCYSLTQLQNRRGKAW
ncbi:MAG: asparagine synthase (glutamine-hydrolyzing) [Sediminibacterium sp.]|nr:MAG: asparagine synthase [Chitinophagaceae bacterium]MDP1842876.1 asparagine synthase (glutamine-hydrolyzing) [Sediminibacterium sp.]